MRYCVFNNEEEKKKFINFENMITGFSGIYEKWMHLMITESYKKKKNKNRESQRLQ